jgi:hypothetical protein
MDRPEYINQRGALERLVGHKVSSHTNQLHFFSRARG